MNKSLTLEEVVQAVSSINSLAAITGVDAKARCCGMRQVGINMFGPAIEIRTKKSYREFGTTKDLSDNLKKIFG